MHHFILDFSSCAEVRTCLSQTRVVRRVFPTWVLCKALGAPHCPCPEITFQLLHPREWMEQSRGSFPREETLGCVSSDVSGRAAMSQLSHSSVTALTTFGLSMGQWRDTKACATLPRLSPCQPQHRSHFKELHIHFSELKTCFYFHVTSLEVFFFCGKELMGIPPEFCNWGLCPVDKGSLIYAPLWTVPGRWGQQMTWQMGTWNVWDTTVISCWTMVPLLFLWNVWDVYLPHGTAWEKLPHMCTKHSFSCITVHSRMFFYCAAYAWSLCAS